MKEKLKFYIRENVQNNKNNFLGKIDNFVSKKNKICDEDYEFEIEKLLESVADSLPKNNYYDLIIRFCFINKIYKLTEINSLLEEYNCKLFNY